MPGTFSPPPTIRKPLVSDPGMHHGTCVTHVPWCMSRSLTRGGGENVPDIPCATRNFTYLARGPCLTKASPHMCYQTHSDILFTHSHISFLGYIYSSPFVECVGIPMCKHICVGILLCRHMDRCLNTIGIFVSTRQNVLTYSSTNLSPPVEHVGISMCRHMCRHLNTSACLWAQEHMCCRICRHISHH